MTKTINRIIGGILCIIGMGVWYVDYLIFSAIGALCGQLAALVDITGEAAFGVMAIGWILTVGIMISVFIVGTLIGSYGVYLLTGSGR